ncbi:16621_t:CDS:2, partial [Dentiscutata erythropus]
HKLSPFRSMLLTSAWERSIFDEMIRALARHFSMLNTENKVSQSITIEVIIPISALTEPETGSDDDFQNNNAKSSQSQITSSPLKIIYHIRTSTNTKFIL